MYVRAGGGKGGGRGVGGGEGEVYDDVPGGCPGEEGEVVKIFQMHGPPGGAGGGGGCADTRTGGTNFSWVVNKAFLL